MSEPLRTETSRAPGGASEADRDRKIEQLLLAGLEHYFASEYEQAINVWSRALFLDRSHAQARAYIDRARGALAERQREGEELLQNGIAAFHRGESRQARQLLKAAMSGGAPPDEALAVLDRLDRLELATIAPFRASTATSRKPSQSAVSFLWVGIGAFIIAAAVFAAATRSTWHRLLGSTPVAASMPSNPASVAPAGPHQP